MAFECIDYPVNALFGFGILQFHRFDAVLGAAEDAEKAAFLFGIYPAELGEQIRYHLTGLAEVAHTDPLEGGVGEFCDLLLSCRSVAERGRAVCNVELGRILVDSLKLGIGQPFRVVGGAQRFGVGRCCRCGCCSSHYCGERRIVYRGRILLFHRFCCLRLTKASFL